MTRIEVFDPPNCCPTGVCGPEVDPALPRVAGDLAWLGRCGTDVARFNLAQQPERHGKPIADLALPLLAFERRPKGPGRRPAGNDANEPWLESYYIS